MDRKLPKGWVRTTLGRIAVPSRLRASPLDVPDMRYVGLEHIEPGTMKLLGYVFGRDTRSSSVRFSKGDVLYGKMRPYLNKVWVAEFDGICSAEFIVFPRLYGLNSQFLALRLNSQDFVSFANGQVSGERPRVDFDKLSGFTVLLPPLAEQERIVAKLHTMFSGLERADRAARHAHRRLENYRAAVIHAAVSGELTQAWRNELQNRRGAPSQSSEALLQHLLTARRALWEQVEAERHRTAHKIPKNYKWKSRYLEPTPPRIEKLPKLPRGWIWASLDQIGQLSRGKSTHRPRNDPRLYGGALSVHPDGRHPQSRWNGPRTHPKLQRVRA